MGTVVYFLVIPLLWFISLMPFWMLYGFSDGLRFLLFRLVRYRRKVIYTNLKNAFPEKSEAELRRLEREFYKNFIDLILETIKEISLSKRGLRKRVSYSAEGIALMRRLRAENRDCIAVMGHCMNWEWGGGGWDAAETHIRAEVLYAPLHNRRFDGLIRWMRSKYGMGLIPKQDAAKLIAERLGTHAAFIFLADQAAHPQRAFWTTFMNQETAVFRGAEKFAKLHDLPVTYFGVRRLGRGRYEGFMEMLVENPRERPEGEIIEIFTRRLEQDVRAHPETWLWSHRRWKHRRPEGVLLYAEQLEAQNAGPQPAAES